MGVKCDREDLDYTQENACHRWGTETDHHYLSSNQGFPGQVKQTPVRSASGQAAALNEPLGTLSMSMTMRHITYRIRISFSETLYVVI